MYIYACFCILFGTDIHMYMYTRIFCLYTIGKAACWFRAEASSLTCWARLFGSSQVPVPELRNAKSASEFPKSKGPNIDPKIHDPHH